MGIKQGLWAIGAFMVSLSAHGNDVQSMAFAFDSLFPPCPYKTMLDMSMQLMDDLATFDQEELELDIMGEDLVVGRMMRLCAAVDNVATFYGPHNPLLPDDIDYMVAILDHMRQVCALNVDDSTSTVKHLIHAMTTKIQQLQPPSIPAPQLPS